MGNPTVYIYALRDPRTSEFRYVGQSVKPIQRARAHASGREGTEARKKWIAEIGGKPELVILEESTSTPSPLKSYLSNPLAPHREAYWKRTLLALGEDLLCAEIHSCTVKVGNENLSELRSLPAVAYAK